jgi:hypothetical protein
MSMAFDTMQGFWDADDAEVMKKLPPDGDFLSGGVFISGRYGHLGLMYDWFGVGGENKFIMGNYSSLKVFPQINADEIPYVGNIIALIDGYFSLEQLLQSLIPSASINDFKAEYKANMLFKEIPLGKKAGLSVAAFSQKNWYDMYAKYDMNGAKIYLSFGEKEDSVTGSFTFFTDIAYRKFFDVVISPEYSEYKDGIYLKLGMFLLVREDAEEGRGYLQLYAESGKKPLLSGAKIGLSLGFSFGGFFTTQAAVDYGFSNRSSVPVNGVVGFKGGGGF